MECRPYSCCLKLVETADCSIVCAEREKCFHSCFARSIELSDNIRDEDDLVRRTIQRSRDATITLRLSFLPDIRIEVIIDEPGEVACVRVREEKLLRQHAARRKDVDAQTCT